MSPDFFKKRKARTERLRAKQRGLVKGHRDAIVGLLLAILLWVSALVLIYSAGGIPQTGLAEGQRAPVTVVAAADFTCVDIPKTELNRHLAEKAVPPVFTVNPVPQTSSLRTLDKLFDRILQIRENAETRTPQQDAAEAMGSAIDLLGISLTPAETLALAPAGSEVQVRDAIRTALRRVWAGGIIAPTERDTGFQGITSEGVLVIRRTDDTTTSPLSVDTIPTPEAALTTAVNHVLEQLEGIRLSKDTLAGLLKPWIVPNLLYDPYLTTERRKIARDEVPLARMTVRAGTTIIEGGDRINAQKLAMLNAHEQRLSELESPHDRLIRRIGNAGLLLAALIACIGLVQILTPDVIGKESRILLLIVLSLLVILPSKGLLYLSHVSRTLPTTTVEFAVPLALAPVIASVLLGSAMALPIGLWVSFAVAILFNNNFTLLTLGLVVTVVAALSTRHVRKRSQLYRAGLVVGLAKVLYAISIGAIRQQPGQVIAIQSLVGLSSGLAGGFVAALLIPIFEWLFKITTDLTLLELSDMGHPLLQRLAMEAPGTYHHSVVVANLGEAAATRVGANSLIVRVGAYFHDVGKLSKPDFFNENMSHRENPHDDLAPTMSTLVITSHVKEGVSLARRYNLPRCVLDAVEQHHGTSLVSFFYHRAKQEAEQANGSKTAGRTLNEQDFRYDGPKPRSREMAILMLADAVEAAARSIEKPTPTRIEHLVNDIVDGKVRDGQLSRCDLTLAQLSEIKQSFVFSLANMLHVRIAYPSDESKSAQQPEKTAGSSDTRQAADTAAGGRSTETRAGDTKPGTVA